ncbi:MAG TPA: copper resistance protein CopC, partial [Dehalococcoidia bacterium]|nr:copper resistance protein CopC [Dehalococcoidia bacterium]
MTDVGWRGSLMRMRSLYALAAAVAALALFAPFATRTAEAHAVLVSSNPENGAQEQRPPFRIVLNFSEPVEPRLTDITVTDKDGGEVDNGDVEVDPADARIASVGVPTLDPGLYTVTFSNVSTVDGHPWNGVFQFIILNPDGSVPEGAEFDPDAVGSSGTGALPENIDAALKWISMLALATAAGAAFFVFAVLRPAASFLERRDYDEAAAAGERWVVNATHVLLPVSFIAGSLLLLVSVNRFETPVGLWEYVTDVQVGRYRGIQLALVAVALAGADLPFLASAPRVKQAGLLLLLAASAGALLMFSLVSHSAVGGGRYWATLSDYLHLLASSAWLGALAMLIPLMLWLRRHFEDDARRYLYLANVFDRFSIVATISVVT